MKRALTLLAACLLFAGFLFSPTFVSAVKGNGDYTLAAGWQHVWFFMDYLVYSFPWHKEDAARMTLLVLPLLLAELGFFVLPVLHFKKFFGYSWLRFMIAGNILAGGVAFSWLVWHEISMNSHVGYGVWLWLMAAMLAVVYCLLKPSGSGKFDPLW